MTNALVTYDECIHHIIKESIANLYITNDKSQMANLCTTDGESLHQSWRKLNVYIARMSMELPFKCRVLRSLCWRRISSSFQCSHRSHSPVLGRLVLHEGRQGSWLYSSTDAHQYTRCKLGFIPFSQVLLFAFSWLYWDIRYINDIKSLILMFYIPVYIPTMLTSSFRHIASIHRFI